MTRRFSATAVAIVACVVASSAAGISGQSPGNAQTTEQVKRRWDKEFAGNLPNLNRDPNALLVSAVKGRAAGTALDLGTGQGRNAIYLAEQGWRVTGVDLSDIAISQAKANAAARNVSVETVVGDLDAFDFGRERWDLILSFYMHAWHDRSPTDVPTRILDALKPGGLLVIEAFAKPEVTYGFAPHELARAFSRLQILRNEGVTDKADWDRQNDRHIVRFVAMKPQAPTPLPVTMAEDETARRIADLQQKGRRYDGQRATLWTPATFDVGAAKELIGQLDKAVAELRTLIGSHPWQAMRDPTVPLKFFVSDESFISYMSVDDGILIPVVRVREQRAPFMTLAAAALLARAVPNVPPDPERAVRVQQTRPRWLADGLSYYLGFTAADAIGALRQDPFDTGGKAGTDKSCASRLTTDMEKVVLPFVGALGAPEALATADRPRVAPAYYACASSFTAYVIGRIGLKDTIALVDLQSRVRRDTNPATVGPDQTLPRIEKLTGEQMSALREKWLAAIRK